MRPAVRFYCPRGVPKPAHRTDLPPAGAELLPGKGPDATLGLGDGGGMVYGGIYVPGEPGWVRTEAGWWVNLGGAIPQHLIRLAPHPRIVRWTVVVGALPEHRWTIPVLIKPQQRDDIADPVYVSALEREWRGDAAGWKAPTDLAELQEQLITVAHDLAVSSDLEANARGITDLTIGLLGIGHLISRYEIAAGGWLSELFMLRTLAAACDVAIELPA